MVALIPKRGQAKGKDVLNKLGENLNKWLKGQLFAMLIVLALTAKDLEIIGAPMWLALALITGILNFTLILVP
jgi:predicted PurR-regulated permease PerM